jgi:hypothetical protein
MGADGRLFACFACLARNSAARRVSRKARQERKEISACPLSSFARTSTPWTSTRPARAALITVKRPIRDLLRAVPFKPFVIRMADGREYRVEHPISYWRRPAMSQALKTWMAASTTSRPCSSPASSGSDRWPPTLEANSGSRQTFANSWQLRNCIANFQWHKFASFPD